MLENEETIQIALTVSANKKNQTAGVRFKFTQS